MTREQPFDRELLAAVNGLRHCRAAWAIAGGWAIDLFLGRPTRPHGDIDIAAWRDEQRTLREFLEPHWQMDVVDNHRMRAWMPDEWLSLPIHEIHARSRALPARQLEFLLNDRDTRQWIYRRDPNERRALDKAVLQRDEIAYLAPEIVLLYKSKAPRPADDSDLDSALPSMSEEQRGWLRRALASQDAAHRWLLALGTPEANVER